MQGCSGVSLMLGYANPWAVWVRKQCEITPVAIQGVYDLAIAMLVDVPFAKCICVDSRYTALRSCITQTCSVYSFYFLKHVSIAAGEATSKST